MKSTYSILNLVALLTLSACASEPGPTDFEVIYRHESLEGTVSAISHYPADRQADLALNTQVTIDFSGPVNFDAVKRFNFRVVDSSGIAVPGVIRERNNGTRLEFTPQFNQQSVLLKPNTRYTVYAEFLQDQATQRLIAPYVFEFKTISQRPQEGNFFVVEIFPTDGWVSPSSYFSVEFSEPVALPTQPINGQPRCTREWADAFQLVSYPLDFILVDAPIAVETSTGRVCVDDENPRFVHYYPDNSLPIYDPDGGNDSSLFEGGSVADLKIRPSDRIFSASSGETLSAGKEAVKKVVPSTADILNFFFN